VTGRANTPRGPAGTQPCSALPAALDQKIAVLRAEGRDRFPGLELSAFVTIRITDHRRSDTEELISRRGWNGTDVDAVWRMPAILIGSTTQIREDLQARRERFGLSYLVTSNRACPPSPRSSPAFSRAGARKTGRPPVGDRLGC
jgi:hypothetical protein